MLLYLTLSNAFKIRLYHRDLYLGLLPDRDATPTMVNYEVCQKFETEFIDLYTEESYIYVKDTTNYCLDVGRERSNTLLFWSHHGGENQRWTIVHGKLNAVRIKYEDLCLEYLPDDDLLRLQNCNESENQLFNLIEDEDEDHGLATQINVTNTHDLDYNALHGGQSLNYGKSNLNSWSGHGNIGMYKKETVENFAESTDEETQTNETNSGDRDNKLNKMKHDDNSAIHDKDEMITEEKNTKEPQQSDNIGTDRLSDKNKSSGRNFGKEFSLEELKARKGVSNSLLKDESIEKLKKSKCGDWDFHDKGHHPEMQAYYDHGHGSAPK